MVFIYGAVAARQCSRAFTATAPGGPMEQTPALTFDAFRLEPPPGGLWRGDTMIAMRPRPLAMLRYLVAHASRLVTKAELRQHIWGGTHVSDTVFRVCVREIRAALGDTAGAPQYLETVARHGYRFHVAEAPDGPPPLTACPIVGRPIRRSEEHTSELQSLRHLVCRLLLEKKKTKRNVKL